MNLPITVIHAPLLPSRSWHRGHGVSIPLRGALGMHYRESVCTAPGVACARCPRQRACLVPQWYDPGSIGSGSARPVALRAHGPLDVSPEAPWLAILTIIGTIPLPHLLADALQAAADGGIGRQRVRHHLGPYTVQGQETVMMMSGAASAWPQPAPLRDFVRPVPSATRCRIRFQSPFQWARRPERREDVRFSTVFRAAVIRYRAIEKATQASTSHRWPDPGDDIQVKASRLRWVDWKRYSARQGYRIPLSGVVGEIVFEGDLTPYVSLLEAMRVLQLGRGTSAGLGAVEVDWA